MTRSFHTLEWIKEILRMIKIPSNGSNGSSGWRFIPSVLLSSSSGTTVINQKFKLWRLRFSISDSFFLTVNGKPRFTYQNGKKVFDPLKTNFGFVRQGRNLPWTRIVMFEWFRLKSSRSVLFFFQSTEISTFLLIITFCSRTNGTQSIFCSACVFVFIRHCFCWFRFSVIYGNPLFGPVQN